jgi:amidase
MSGKPLWQMSACDLAANIAAGEITCEEAVTATVERMRTVNPKLNAVVDDMGDDAIAEARRHDELLTKSGPLGPLHGVPVTIKEMSTRRAGQRPMASKPMPASSRRTTHRW